MIEICSSTRRSVGKAGRERPDKVEEGSMARRVEIPVHLCGRAKFSDALIV